MALKTRLGGGVLAAACGVILAAIALSLANAADAKHGQTVFQNCIACHNDQPGALGPSLKGVYDRKAGALEDFHYSNAMKHAGFLWDAANLKAYLADPQAKVKGNRMPFSGFQNPADIDDIIAYLQTLK